MPDNELPDLETKMDDLVAVMDAAGSRRAILFGESDGGPLCALFAATYPDRVLGLVMHGPDVRAAWAPDAPWGMTSEDFKAEVENIEVAGAPADSSGDSSRRWPRRWSATKTS